MIFTIVAAVLFTFMGFKYEAYVHEKQVKKLERVMEVKYKDFKDCVREEHYQGKDKEFEKEISNFFYQFAKFELSCSEFEMDMPKKQGKNQQ